MNNSINLFEQLLQHFTGHPPERVFDDFLSVAICLLAADSPQQTPSPFNFEAWYSEVSRPYTRREQKLFPFLLHVLIEEIQKRVNLREDPDVLGEYYQQYFMKEEELLILPYNAYLVMAHALSKRDTPLIAPDFMVTDCRSGGLISALFSAFGEGRMYYGLEHNPVCAKMAAINVFLRGVSDAEILYADAPDGFSVSYKITGSPHSLTIITRKEDSKLWAAKTSPESNMNVVSLSQIQVKPR